MIYNRYVNGWIGNIKKYLNKIYVFIILGFLNILNPFIYVLKYIQFKNWMNVEEHIHKFSFSLKFTSSQTS